MARQVTYYFRGAPPRIFLPPPNIKVSCRCWAGAKATYLPEAKRRRWPCGMKTSCAGESAVKERVYLGPQIIGSDLWGRPIQIATQEDEQRCAYQELAVDAVPIFITGIDRGVAMFDITLRFDSNALVTKYGQDEANAITFENHFGSSMKGTINLAFPKTWKVDRSLIPISLSAADAPRREPIRVGLLDTPILARSWCRS